MLERLKKLNQNIKLYSVKDDEFLSYGKIINTFDATPIIDVAATLENPQSGSMYVPSEVKFETLPTSIDLKKCTFGELPAQVGYCWGYNSFLNAAEWHTSSEINIAITPIVLLLAHTYEIKNGTIDSSEFRAFYVPQGTVIEVFATSLHFCPCQVEETGFGCVVVLPEGTNTPLDKKTDNPLLFRKNKWLIAHNDNNALIGRGVVPGISGENYEIKYR